MPVKDDDFSLLESAHNGDQKSAQILYHRWRPYILFFFLRGSIPEPVSIELVNETFLILFTKSRVRYESCASFKTYLTTIVLNLLRKEKRSRGVREKYGWIFQTIHDQEKTSLDDVELKEMKDIVSETIARLDTDDQNLIREYYFEGKSIPSIAMQNGLSEDCIYQRIHRVKKRLRRDKKLSFLRPAYLFVAVPLVIALIAGGAFAWFEYFSWKKANDIFWGPFLNSTKTVNIVFGNSPVWIPLDGLKESDGVFFPYTNRVNELGLNSGLVKKGMSLSANNKYIGTGDAEAALSISTMLGILKSDLFRQDRIHIFTTADLEKTRAEENANIVFIGGPSVNKLANEVIAGYFKIDPAKDRVKEGYHIYLPKEAEINESAFVWKTGSKDGGVRSVDGEYTYACGPDGNDYGILFSLYDLTLNRKIVWSVGYMGDATFGGIHILTDLSRGANVEQMELLNEAEEKTITEARRLGYSVAITEAIVKVPMTTTGKREGAEFVTDSFVHIYR